MQIGERSINPIAMEFTVASLLYNFQIKFDSRGKNALRLKNK